jgi:hypothetical protein
LTSKGLGIILILESFLLKQSAKTTLSEVEACLPARQGFTAFLEDEILRFTQNDKNEYFFSVN